MKKVFFAFILSFLIFTSAFAQSKDETAIRNTMNEQLNAWNAGNINRFMNTYWHDDSLMFIGKSGVTYGWQKTLENYKKNYPDTAAMGQLDFNIIQVRRLSDDYYFVVGKWHLTRSIGNMGGHFTLLFRKIKNNWMIVADHTS